MKYQTICILCLISITISCHSDVQQDKVAAIDDTVHAQVELVNAPEIWPSATPGPYAVGYTVFHEYDHTRTFKPKYDYFGKPTQGSIFRPIQISVWYPVDPIDDPQYMMVKDYYQTKVTETDFTTPSDEQLKILLQHLKQIWPIEFRIPPEGREAIKKRIDSAFQVKVFAVKDAPPTEGTFPLIVHMPGYNSSPYDLACLFEYLASHGYVIAAVPNMGMYRRNIDNEEASLDVQARDLEFVTAYMSSLPYVNPDRTGTTGMSWGGMSNVLYGQRNYDVDAVLTLDGAITMPEELKLIEAVPGYSHKSFKAAYMQLLVSPADAKFRPKDLRFYDSLEYCDAHMIQYRDVDHDAFACGYLRMRDLRESDPERIAYLEKFTRDIYQNALQFFNAYLKNDTAALTFLANQATSINDPSGHDEMVVLRDYKRAKRRPMSRREFIDIIKAQGAEKSLEIYKDYCKFQPQNNLIISSSIGPLFMDTFERGDYKEALAICELWETGLPRARGPLFSKARIYTETGEKEKAIQCFEKILTLEGSEQSTEHARQWLQKLNNEHDAKGMLKVEWLGQSSFKMSTNNGTTIITDPVDFKGYHMAPNTTADIVTVSHEHPDHNCVEALSGTPVIFHGTDKRLSKVNVIDTTVNDVRLYTVPSFHDPGHHGMNAIFVFEFDGIRVAHLGDIGTVLTDSQISAIGEVDILMVPVGGQFTIAAAEADTIVNQLGVRRAVIPMHYKTAAFDDLPYSVEPFLVGKENIRRVDGSEFSVDIEAANGAREYIVSGY